MRYQPSPEMLNRISFRRGVRRLTSAQSPVFAVLWRKVFEPFSKPWMCRYFDTSRLFAHAKLWARVANCGAKNSRPLFKLFLAICISTVLCMNGRPHDFCKPSVLRSAEGKNAGTDRKHAPSSNFWRIGISNMKRCFLVSRHARRIYLVHALADSRPRKQQRN